MTPCCPSRSHNTILVLLLTAATLLAQIQPSPASGTHEHPVANPAAIPTVLENHLAASFEAARASQHLRHLARIPDRPALRQLTCTAAQTGDPPHFLLDLESNAASTIVRTNDPGRLPPEFDRIISYSDGGADPSHKIERYSLSVWPDPHHPDTYWIGIALYWSRLRQAFAVRFTRDYAALNLRPYLAPACRDVH